MAVLQPTYAELNAVDQPQQVLSSSGNSIGTYTPPAELYELLKKMIQQLKDITKVINSLSGNLQLQQASGMVDGSNKIFTFASTPLLIFVGSLAANPLTEYTLTGLKVVFTTAPNDATIFAVTSPN